MKISHEYWIFLKKEINNNNKKKKRSQLIVDFISGLIVSRKHACFLIRDCHLKNYKQWLTVKKTPTRWLERISVRVGIKFFLIHCQRKLAGNKRERESFRSPEIYKSSDHSHAESGSRLTRAADLRLLWAGGEARRSAEGKRRDPHLSARSGRPPARHARSPAQTIPLKLSVAATHSREKTNK